MKKKRPQSEQGPFSELYYREKAMALSSCQVLAQLASVDDFIGRLGMSEEQIEMFDQALTDSIEFLGNNIAPFVRETQPDAVKEALEVINGKKQ